MRLELKEFAKAARTMHQQPGGVKRTRLMLHLRPYKTRKVFVLKATDGHTTLTTRVEHQGQIKLVEALVGDFVAECTRLSVPPPVSTTTAAATTAAAAATATAGAASGGQPPSPPASSPPANASGAAAKEGPSAGVKAAQAGGGGSGGQGGAASQQQQQKGGSKPVANKGKKGKKH